MKPKVLLVTTSRWFSTARLAMALDQAGCAVDVVCPQGHPVEKTNAPGQIYEYHGLLPLMSVKKAIGVSKPDLLVPVDDLATMHLHALYVRESPKVQNANAISDLITRSLGAPEHFSLVHGRTAFMELAAEEGIRVPETRVIDGPGELRSWTARIGFPFVLKADRTSGGTGVRVVNTLEEAERAFRHLQAPPTFSHALRQIRTERDTTVVWPSVLREKRKINAQAYIAGREATSTVFCWQGRVLAGLHFEVLKTAYAAGPATVVRLLENQEMISAAEKIARGLNLSGFHGFDYMLELDSDGSYLIEMNPRATQAAHLALGAGRNLPSALMAAFSPEPAQASRVLTENPTIAFFPQEWLRDPASPFLKSAYHDVPWEEPGFVAACVRGANKPKAVRSADGRSSALSAVRVPPS